MEDYTGKKLWKFREQFLQCIASGGRNLSHIGVCGCNDQQQLIYWRRLFKIFLASTNDRLKQSVLAKSWRYTNTSRMQNNKTLMTNMYNIRNTFTQSFYIIRKGKIELLIWLLDWWTILSINKVDDFIFLITIANVCQFSIFFHCYIQKWYVEEAGLQITISPQFCCRTTLWNVRVQMYNLHGMGDCLRAGKLSHYVTSHPGQLSLSSFRGR